MSINSASIVTIYQGKLQNITSSTSTYDIIRAIDQYTQFGGTFNIAYDSAGELPIDSDYAGMIVSVAGGLYVSNGSTWSSVSSGGSSGGEGDGGGGGNGGGGGGGEEGSSWQGSSYGYVAGGYVGSFLSTTEKFSLSSDGNATSGGALTATLMNGQGHSTANTGYISGGQGSSQYTKIQSFSTATGGSASDIGDLSHTVYAGFGHNTASTGYTSSGFPGSPADMQSWSLSSGTASTVGTLSTAEILEGASHQSTSYAYVSGGTTPGGVGERNTIYKFSFAEPTSTLSLVGSLLTTVFSAAGQSSTDYGFSSGGYKPPNYTNSNVIQKFDFASDASAVNVAQLSLARNRPAGASSTTHGYTAGGWTTGYANAIDKFAFAVAANATSVGSLGTGRTDATGHQS